MQSFLSTSCLIISPLEEGRGPSHSGWGLNLISKALALPSLIELGIEVPSACFPWLSSECLTQCCVSGLYGLCSVWGLNAILHVILQNVSCSNVALNITKMAWQPHSLKSLEEGLPLSFLVLVTVHAITQKPWVPEFPCLRSSSLFSCKSLALEFCKSYFQDGFVKFHNLITSVKTLFPNTIKVKRC